MKAVSFTILLILISLEAMAQNKKADILPADIQIKTAVLAAPEDGRNEATVWGYNEAGEMVILREGSNNLICLADDPEKEGIHVSCYSEKLEPFMARGRELRAEGKETAEIREIRQKEVEEGSLKMPDVPSMLYVLDGTEGNYNRETGELKDGALRYVIHIPYATTEETGLPDKPHLPGMPWLMDPGTHRAHIMITPEKIKE